MCPCLDRVGVFAFCPAGSVSAKAWVDFLIQEQGEGRGGGKADQANASFTVSSTRSVEDLQQALVDAATRFFATATNA